MARTIVAASVNEEQVDAIVAAVTENGLATGGIRVLYPLRTQPSRSTLIYVRCENAEMLRQVEALLARQGAEVVSRRPIEGGSPGHPAPSTG